MRSLPITILTLALPVAVAVAGDWPRYRGSDFDGISKEKGWLGAWPGGQPKQLWKKNVGIGFADVTVSGGHLFTVGNKEKQDTVYCFDAGTGEEIWHYSFKEDLDPKYYEGGPSATPTVAGDSVYTLSKTGQVLCLDAATGKVRWQKNVQKSFDLAIPDWGFAGSPHVQGDLVILNAGTSGVALNKSSGEKVWVSAGKEPAGYGTPVPFVSDGKPLLAIFGAKQVYAVDAATGTVAWSHPWKTEYDVNSADPVISGDLMFLSSGYGTGGAVIQFTGGKPQQLWFNKEVHSHFQSGVAIGGYLYAVDGQGGDKNSKLKCLDLNTGKVAWSSPAAETGTLSAADGKILWLTGKGELVVVEAKPDKYEEVARAQVTGGKCWTAPVLANGRVYVRNAKGDVVCVDVKGSGPVI
jgi:outer membrane protein assembly factor BamB